MACVFVQFNEVIDWRLAVSGCGVRVATVSGEGHVTAKREAASTSLNA
jgi:hypothetical protein